MKRTLIVFLGLLLTLSARAGTTPPAPTPAPSPTAVASPASVVRVNSTNQNFDFFRPWQKKLPFSRRGLGAVIEGGRVLTSAELVANHTFIELETASGGVKSAATVVAVDYETNLALLAPTDPDFLAKSKPLGIDDQARVGDRIELLQLESNGSLATTAGTITTITVANYPLDQIALLVFRVSLPLQFRDQSFTLPAVRNGSLVGILMRYDTRSQTGDLVPAPVIRRFLSAAVHQPFENFPRAGMSFAALRDPQLRRYVGIAPDAGGVYVTEIVQGGPAQKAGLQEGDILLKVGEYAVDSDGNYEDPVYGRIPFSHLTNTVFPAGKTVEFTVFRNGKTVNLPVELEAPDPKSIISENLVADQQPRYFILGGLVLQELSRSYLREWGPDWKKEAPQRLVYIDEFQREQAADRGKVVFLSQILPSDLAIGYDELDHVIVKKVNDRQIRNLDDVAEAVKTPIHGYHKIEIEEDPGVMYIDADLARDQEKALLDQYQIPAASNL